MRKLNFFDILSILKLMLRSEKKLNKGLNDYFKNQFEGDFVLLDKGRSALKLAFEDFNIKNCEVIIPSFICSDVFLPLFAHYNVIPKLIDCEKGKLTVSVKDAEKLINKRTRGIIVPHVLGIPNHPEEFRELCNKYGLTLIEDCAHCTSNKLNDKYLGSYGDCAIFSLVKEFPSFIGGVYLNNKRKISPTVLKEIECYKFSKSDLIFLLSKFKIYLALLKIRKRIASEGSISGKSKIWQIRRMPKLGKAFSFYFLEKMNIEKNRNISLKIYELLKDNNKIDIPANEKDLLNSSGKSFPILCKDQKRVISELQNIGLNPGCGWRPALSRAYKGKLGKTPAAESYSDNLITISINELDDNKINKLVKFLI